MGIYAANTGVSCDRSEQEIKRTLRRYGGDDIVIGDSARAQTAFVQFRFLNRAVRITVPLPDQSDKAFTLTESGKWKRTAAAAEKAWERACRQNWRILILLIKAQMEAISLGIVTADEAFLPWLVMPSGRTIGEQMIPQLEAALKGGVMPKMLPGPMTNGG